jgi:hypothetical protein
MHNKMSYYSICHKPYDQFTIMAVHHHGGVTSFRGGNVFVVYLFWQGNSLILIKSPSFLQRI